MKKVVLSLAFVAAVLVSCNKKGDANASADSANVNADSVTAPLEDSFVNPSTDSNTVAPTEADSNTVAPAKEEEKK